MGGCGATQGGEHVEGRLVARLREHLLNGVESQLSIRRIKYFDEPVGDQPEDVTGPAVELLGSVRLIGDESQANVGGCDLIDRPGFTANVKNRQCPAAETRQPSALASIAAAVPNMLELFNGRSISLRSRNSSSSVA